RAWAAITRALTRSNVLINEQNQAAGVIEVSYLPGSEEEEEEEGFFSRLFSFSDDIPEPTTLLNRVQRSNNVIEVQVLPADGASNNDKQDGEPPATQLLYLIRNTIA